MTGFLSRWLVLTIAAAVMVMLLPGMVPIGHPPILGIAAFALFLALINVLVKPTLRVLSQLAALPLSILTLGLFAVFVSLIVNWLCMRLASWCAVSLFGVGVSVSGFWVSVIGSAIMAVVSALVNAVIGR